MLRTETPGDLSLSGEVAPSDGAGEGPYQRALRARLRNSASLSAPNCDAAPLALAAHDFDMDEVRNRNGDVIEHRSALRAKKFRPTIATWI